jgi:hypothetical protein
VLSNWQLLNTCAKQWIIWARPIHVSPACTALLSPHEKQQQQQQQH